MDATPDEKQEILETVDIGARLQRVSQMLAHRIEVLRLSAGDRSGDQGFARRAQPRGSAARADGGDPAPTWRERRRKDGRNRRAREGDRQRQNAEGGRGPGAQGAQPPAAHAGSRRRIWDGAHLSRLAGRIALEPSGRDADRHRRRPPHPRCGPLRPREDQAPDPRISRRPQARPQRQGADPLLRRTSRRRQDFARPVDRARDGPQIRPGQPRRRA